MKPVTKKEVLKIRNNFYKPTKTHNIKKAYNRKKEKDWKQYQDD